jgi:hypothetical protein
MELQGSGKKPVKHSSEKSAKQATQKSSKPDLM